MKDPAGFFANVFGGERFMDYVRFAMIDATLLSTDPISNRSGRPL